METLCNQFQKAEKVIVYVNGKQFEPNINEFLIEFNKLTEKSYFSPAFGVSIHDLTIKEMEKGYWVEFVFSNIEKFAEMEFSKLLINIKPEYYGFNIIRCYENQYFGRCYYINLLNNSNNFYKYLVKSFK